MGTLQEYPLKCPSDFKKFGTLVGEMVAKSRCSNKGDCVIPFLKELLTLSLKKIEVDEMGQVQSHINTIWQVANRKRRGGKKQSKFKVKEEVEANYMNTGEWYRAIVVDVMKGQKYRLKYPDYDDELEENVPEARSGRRR